MTDRVEQIRNALKRAGWSLGTWATDFGYHVEAHAGGQIIHAVAKTPLKAWSEVADAARLRWEGETLNGHG